MKKYLLTKVVCFSFFFFLLVACNPKANDTAKEEWAPLFNGKDLADWDIKIKDHSLGENYKNTFRIEDSMIRVVYSDYEKFNNQFGHLYTHKPYS